MAKKDVIEAEGKVVEAQPNAMFIVELETVHKAVSYTQLQAGTEVLCEGKRNP